MGNPLVDLEYAGNHAPWNELAVFVPSLSILGPAALLVSNAAMRHHSHHNQTFCVGK